MSMDRDLESLGSSQMNTRTHKNDMVMGYSKIDTPKDLRLDSRINPKKSIILDISIKDRMGNKTVKHKNNQKINDLRTVHI